MLGPEDEGSRKELQSELRGNLSLVKECADVFGQTFDSTDLLVVYNKDDKYRWQIQPEGSGAEVSLDAYYGKTGHMKDGYMKMDDWNGDGSTDSGGAHIRPELYMCGKKKSRGGVGKLKPDLQETDCSRYQRAYEAAISQTAQICGRALNSRQGSNEKMQPLCSDVSPESLSTLRGRYNILLSSIPQIHLDRVGVCSGAFVGDNLVLTAGHCTSSAEEIIEVSWPVGENPEEGLYLAPVEVVAQVYDPEDPREDIALLALPVDSRVESLDIDYGDFEGTQPAVTIGHPNGASWILSEFTASTGFVLWSEDTMEKYEDLFIFRGGQCYGPGNSGGPFLNDQNKVAGVVVAVGHLDGNGYAIKVSYHQSWLTANMNGDIDRPEGSVKSCKTNTYITALTADGVHLSIMPDFDSCE